VVHTGSGGEVETVVSGAAYRRPELLSAFPEDPIRPGVVHRLDKETSGVMVLAKHPQAREELVAAFADRRVRKRYLAILKGVPPSDRGTVTAPIQRYPHNRKRYRAVPAQSEAPGGKAAESEYRVIRHFGNYSFVELRPKTGRTHQLRVHMSSLGAPVLGDPTYARRDPRYPDATMMLHAYELHLPVSGRDQIAAFVAPIPHRIRQMLATLRYPSNP
jgi:23S rRNA pseudouridine1911/1915/1917 synthase